MKGPGWPTGGGTDGRTDGQTDGRTDRRKDGRLEIHPCVLQDIGPLGPLPKKHLKCSFSHFLIHTLSTDQWTNGWMDIAS